jgi:DUF1680 family protein
MLLKTLSRFIACAFGPLLCLNAETLSPKPTPFAEVPLARIRLLDSPFKTRQDLHRRVLVSYDLDRLLSNFRVTAGLPPKGESYGGWESPGCGLRGHFAGHYLSACATMYAATGDAAFKARVDQIVNELAECQSALGTGYLSAFPATEFDTLETKFFDGIWAPYYTIHKIMTGLLDAHTHAGNPRALAVVTAMADYFAGRLERLSPEAVEKMTRTDYKGNPVNEYGGIAESLLAVYHLTGNPRHLAAARCFLRDWFIAPLAAGENRLAKLHANTHVPQALSLALASDVVPEARLLPAAKFFFAQVTERHAFAFGGNAFDEKFHAPGIESADFTDLTGETCNTHNLLRFSRALFARTGDPRYAAYHEHALYNHILASIASDTGNTTYHVAAQPGRFKVYGTHDGCFLCCTGTGIENTSRYGQGVYFTSGRDVWVNLYIPSSVELPSVGLTLSQTSAFPASDQVRFAVKATTPSDATLRLRVPGWLAAPASVRLNGTALDAAAAAQENGYLVITRIWQEGDTLDLTLPMAVRTRTAMDDPALVSFFYGPVLLAGALGRADMPPTDIVNSQTEFHKLPASAVPDLDSISPASLLPVTGQPLTFVARSGDGAVQFIPFYELHHQRYSLYWRAKR